MKCTGCGVELFETSAFCPYCGAKNENVIIEEASNNNTKPKEKKVWQVFAKIAYVFGIISIIGSGITFASSFNVVVGAFGLIFSIIIIELATPGIVFAALGKKSETYRSRANSALVLNIISVCLATIAIIIYYIVFFVYIFQVDGGYNDYYYYMFR